MVSSDSPGSPSCHSDVRFWPKGDNSPRAWLSAKQPIADRMMVKRNRSRPTCVLILRGSIGHAGNSRSVVWE